MYLRSDFLSIGGLRFESLATQACQFLFTPFVKIKFVQSFNNHK